MPGNFVPLPVAGRYIPTFKMIHNVDGSVKFTMPDGRWWTIPSSIKWEDVAVDIVTGDLQHRKGVKVSDWYPGAAPGMPPLGPAPAFPTYTSPHTTPYIDPMITVMQDQIKRLEADMAGMQARMNSQDIEMGKMRTTLTDQGAEMYALGQENRELHERNYALEEQNEAVNEQLDEARQDLADEMKKHKKPSNIVENPHSVVASGGRSVPAAQEYTINVVPEPGLNADQIAARVTRDLTRNRGVLKNP